MGRGLQVLIVASILLAWAGLAAIVTWQAKLRHIPLQYVTGTALVVVGVGFQVLHLTVSDDYLHRHFGEPSATLMRHMWRGGWLGVLIGALTIAAAYFLGTGP
jgi:hypothetical protein